MRILHVITSLRTGGAERLMVDLLPRLRDRGNEVELLVFDGLETPFMRELAATGITIHTLGSRENVYHPIYLWKLWRFLRRHRFDIVHTHNTACQLFTAVVSVLCSVVLCTTEHNTTNRRRDWWWYARVDRWMYRRYRAIVCIGQTALDNLVAHLGNNRGMTVIHNGIDIARFSSPIKDITGQQRYIGIMVAGFRYQKDQDTVIRAFAQLPGNYELWLVGDGERRAELEALIDQQHMSDRVRMLGVRSDVPQLLAQADFTILSSHWEGLSLASVECMASGRPLIASDVQGIREVVSGNGILFPHGDHTALATAIEQLCGNPTEYRATAHRCQQAAQQYDIANTAERYDEVYKNTFI